MKRTSVLFKLVLSVAGVVALFCVILGWTPVHAQDVYNFYFQKGAAPQSVIQGGGWQTANNKPLPPQDAPVVQEESPAPSASAPQSQPQQAPKSLATTTEVAQDAPREPRWSLRMGYAGVEVGNRRSFGPRLALGGNFNRFVGLVVAGAMYSEGTLNTNDRGTISMSEFGRQDVKGNSGELSLVLTPIRINAFGWDLITLGVVGGGTVLTTRTIGPRFENEFCRNGSIACPGTEVSQTHILPHAGVRADVNFDRHFGISGEVRKLFGDDKLKSGGYTASVNLGFRF